MKALLKKLKSAIKELLFILIPIPFVLGIIGLFSCFFSGNENGLEGFVALFSIGLGLLFLNLYWNRRSSFAEPLTRGSRDLKFTYFVIEEITKESFCLQQNNYDTRKEDAYTAQDRIIYWRNIEDIVFNETETELTLYLKDQTKLIFPCDYNGWYALIAQVPASNYPSFDERAVERIYKKFQACKICAAVAVVNKECQHCYNNVWEKAWEVEEGRLEADYIREEQLSHFATDEEGEAIDFSLGTFNRAPDWELLVSEEAILNYSAEFYWK